MKGQSIMNTINRFTPTTTDDTSPASSPSPVAATASPCPTANGPSATPAAQHILDAPGEFGVQEPGTYSLDVVYGFSHEPVTNDVIFRSCPPIWVLFTIPADGWRAWIGSFKPEEGEGCDPAGLNCPEVENRSVGFTIINVTNLVVDGCLNHRPADPPVGPTVDDLASALADLPPFLVTSPPRDVTIYGYSGKHLELTVPDMPIEVRADKTHFTDCFEDDLISWMGEPLSYAFHGYTGPGQIEEFWILDVEGNRMVIEANWSPDSPPEDIAEMRAILDSIQIEW